MPQGMSVAEIRHATSAERPVPCGLRDDDVRHHPGREDPEEHRDRDRRDGAPAAREAQAHEAEPDAARLEERDQR